MQPQKKFVDTNIFIYSLFLVDKQKHQKTVSLFKKATEGKIHLWTTEWVIAELVWFMLRKKVTVDECKKICLQILSTKGLEVRNKQLILQTLDVWNGPLNFMDAIHVVNSQLESVKEFISYDRDFTSISGVKVIGPE